MLIKDDRSMQPKGLIFILLLAILIMIVIGVYDRQMKSDLRLAFEAKNTELDLKMGELKKYIRGQSEPKTVTGITEIETQKEILSKVGKDNLQVFVMDGEHWTLFLNYLEDNDCVEVKTNQQHQVSIP